MNPDDKIIEDIIKAFGTYALGDIKHNVETKPVAAFILCSCLIDQLACFVYHEPTEKNKVLYKRFIEDFLPHYRPLNLYVNLRCKLVHNYTVGQHIRLSSEIAPYENIGLGKNVNVLTALMMYNELKEVFDKISAELLNPVSKIRENAIKQYKYENGQVITKSEYKLTTYLEKEADILISHFTPILCMKINQKGKNISIDSLSKREISPGRFLVLVNISYGKRGKTKESVQVDVILEKAQQESSSSVLNRLDRIE